MKFIFFIFLFFSDSFLLAAAKKTAPSKGNLSQEDKDELESLIKEVKGGPLPSEKSIKTDEGTVETPLQLIAHFEFPFGMKFKKIRLGGLSACGYNGKHFYALSDDRGKYGEPRIYKFDLNLNAKNFSLTPKEIIYLKNGTNVKLPPVIDAEGMVLWPGGSGGAPEFLVSLEGDNDRKPRMAPELLWLDAKGVLKKRFDLPEEMRPEATGAQHKGTQNNKSLEGLAYDSKNKTLWLALEAPLIQDLDEENIFNPTRVMKLSDFNLSSSQLGEADTYFYLRAKDTQNPNGAEVFKGVTDILPLHVQGEDKILMLERGVRISVSEGWLHSIKLFSVDFSQASKFTEKQIRKMSHKEKHEASLPHKKLLIDLENKNDWGLGAIENFEGLCEGPLHQGQPSFFMISDDNFSSRSRTQVLWLTFKAPLEKPIEVVK